MTVVVQGFHLVQIAGLGLEAMGILAATAGVPLQIRVTGQAPGMRATGLMYMMGASGQIPGRGPAVGNLFATALNTLGCCVGWFASLWNANRQIWADARTSTVVCSVPKQVFSLTPPRNPR